MPDDFEILTINLYRQWNRIDLNIELSISIGGVQKEVAINIENKWYTSLGKDQLKKYYSIIQKHYENTPYTFYNILISEGEISASDIIDCQSNNFKFTSLDELQRIIGKSAVTGNNLFDEFWINF